MSHFIPSESFSNIEVMLPWVVQLHAWLQKWPKNRAGLQMTLKMWCVRQHLRVSDHWPWPDPRPRSLSVNNNNMPMFYTTRGCYRYYSSLWHLSTYIVQGQCHERCEHHWHCGHRASACCRRTLSLSMFYGGSVSTTWAAAVSSCLCAAGPSHCRHIEPLACRWVSPCRCHCCRCGLQWYMASTQGGGR